MFLQYRDTQVSAWNSLAPKQLKGAPAQPENSDVLLPLLPAVGSCHHLMAQGHMPEGCCSKECAMGAAALGYESLRPLSLLKATAGLG